MTSSTRYSRDHRMDSESAPINETNLGKQRNRPDMTRKVEEFHAVVGDEAEGPAKLSPLHPLKIDMIKVVSSAELFFLPPSTPHKLTKFSASGFSSPILSAIALSLWA
jgi:hypothetical protein